jgi:excisionase family DNA binding protein
MKLKTDAVKTTIEVLQKALREADDTEKVITLTDRLMSAVDRLGKDDFEKLWTQEQAAEFLGVKPDTVRHWVSEQRIPCIKVGSLNRFDKNSLKKWALEKETKVHEAWR